MHKPKLAILTFFISLVANSQSGQPVFSNIDIELNTVRNNNITYLVCSNSTFSFKFQLKGKTVVLQNNFVRIDSQLVQITPLQISGVKINPGNLDSAQQRKFLENYSQYELDYFAKELNVEIKDPQRQWVVIKSRGWLVWYFHAGNLPSNLKNRFEIQLYASTIVADKILTINAPGQIGGNHAKASVIVNSLMESLKIGK